MLPQITHEHACCSISVLAISSPESGGDISLPPRLAALPGQVRMLILLTFAAIAFLSDQISKRVVQTRVVGAVGGPLFQIREVHHRERILRPRRIPRGSDRHLVPRRHRSCVAAQFRLVPSKPPP